MNKTYFKNWLWLFLLWLIPFGAFASPPSITTVGLVGDATSAVWDETQAVPMTQDPNNSDVWIIEDIVLIDGLIKFVADNDWATSWGGGTFPSGSGGDNIAVTAGTYTIALNSVTGVYNFELTSVEMIGEFDGWAGTPMTKDANNPFLWTLTNVTVSAGDNEFKFRKAGDWNYSWGINDNGFPDGNTNFGGGNMSSLPAGKYDITFNQASGEYSFSGISDPSASPYGVISLVGAFNGWDAVSGQIDLQNSANNADLWTVEDVTLPTGELKFVADNDWNNDDWGNADFPFGVAQKEGANNIPVQAGEYDISFNAFTGNYEFTSVGIYKTIGVIGSATPQGWNASTSMERDPNNAVIWTIKTELSAGEIKFRANNAWDDNWGQTAFPTGTAQYGSGDNITVPAGFYEITFNSFTGDYNFNLLTPTAYSSVKFIGTFDGWTGASMTQDLSNSNLWTLENVTLGDYTPPTEGVKFIKNDGSDTYYGAVDFPNGKLEGGDNLGTIAGTYDVVFNSFTDKYQFIDKNPFLTVGLIGDATKLQNWTDIVPMTASENNNHEWTLTTFLTVGNVKFKSPNPETWFGGTGFPSGTESGDNIAVSKAGYYEVSFNSLLKTYSFTRIYPTEYPTMGISGKFNGWTYTSMTKDPNDPHAWKAENVALTGGTGGDNGMKFRPYDNSWDTNWGGDSFPKGIANSTNNIPSEASTYNVYFNDVTKEYFAEFIFDHTGPVVTLVPENPSINDPIKVIFDARQGNTALKNASEVYIHTGVVLEPDGKTWTNTVGNWGQDDNIGKMTKVSDEDYKWEITLNPSARDYYGLSADEIVFRLSMVFRDATGSAVGKDANDQDIFMDIDAGKYILIKEPAKSEVFVQPNEKVNLFATASEMASQFVLLVDGQQVKDENNVKELTYEYTPNGTEWITVSYEANLGGDIVTRTKSIHINAVGANQIADFPTNFRAGINYHENDPTKATLILPAPNKKFAYVVGDFNDWKVSPNYQMNQTPNSEYLWLELSDLEEDKSYVFQYWVDGSLKIADFYADQIADPWNDKHIAEETHPNLPQYDKTEFGLASVLRTGQEAYQWQVNNFKKPKNEDAIVYELLIRDFDEKHDYQSVINRLDYLKKLGINVLELMPVNEFEGNESWGYNPSFYFAPDKYYGHKNDLKRLVDECHKRGIAVVIDMVLNHSFGQSPMVRMYWNDAQNQPSADNPWFRETHNMENTDAHWGYDFDHESTYTEAFVDSVNHYWIEEYHVDGFRFDFTKGFTNEFKSNATDNWASVKDDSRITILKRMTDKIREYDPNAYVIFEHLANNNEETILANHGIMLWGNMHFAYKDALNGYGGGNIGGTNYQSRGWTKKSLVGYMESHDENRITYEALHHGNANGNYDIQTKKIALERMSLGSAFLYTVPGPKMIWQFGELGYDFHINTCSDGVTVDGGCRVANKPIPWGSKFNLNYHQDPERQELLKETSKIINLRTRYPEVFSEGQFSWNPDGNLRNIHIAHSDFNVVVIGNFGMTQDAINPAFQTAGNWFDIMSEENYKVENTNAFITLNAGEYRIFTSKKVKLEDPKPEVPIEPTPKPKAPIADLIPLDLPNFVFGDGQFIEIPKEWEGLEIMLKVVSGNAKIVGNQIVPTGSGEIKVQIITLGNSEFGTTIVTFDFEVAKGKPTLNPDDFKVNNLAQNEAGFSPNFGENIAFEIAEGQEFITIDANGNLVPTGVGTVTLKIWQTETNNFENSEPIEITFEITKATQNIDFQEVTNITFDENLTISLSATATSGLAVSFEALTDNIEIQGNTVKILKGGKAEIKATQAGNDLFFPAESVTESFTISRKKQEITFEAISDITLNENSELELKASATSGLPITFKLQKGEGEISVNLLKINGSGNFKIKASQSGDERYLPANPEFQSFEVLPQIILQKVNFDADNYKILLDFELLGSVSDLKVQLSDKNGNFENVTKTYARIQRNEGKITVSVPENIEEGDGYKIRILGSKNLKSNVLSVSVKLNPKPETPWIKIEGTMVCASIEAEFYQWFLKNIETGEFEPIVGATERCLDLSTIFGRLEGESQIVAVQGINGNRKGNLSTPITYTEPTAGILGIESELKSDLRLYPNPTNGRFTVELNLKKSQNVILRLVNTLGEEIMTETYKNAPTNLTKQFDLEAVSNGIYFLSIQIENGQMTTYRIVKSS